MKNLFPLFVFILSVVSASAQSYTVKGQIVDENKVALETAMVVLLNAQDSTMLGYSMTDQKGQFKIGDIQKGKVKMQITYVGYGTIQRTLDLNGDLKVVDLGTIPLAQNAELLQNVTISAEYVPIRISKDTIEFNADAFKVQPNATVEELLKKLPGVEVDNAGTITVKGEEVKAVTVDGKDFFGKDPKMATRNLPADAVKRVQIFDKKSKNAQFSGVDDGNEEKTINLELKENRKNGLFGNAMAGYGTSDRYESKGIINQFSAKRQWSVIANANNLNQQGISANDASSLATGGSSPFQSSAPINWGGQMSSGDTKSATVGLNYNHEFTKTNKFNLSYYLTDSKTDLREVTNSNTFVSDSSLISHRLKTNNSKSTAHNFSTAIDFKIDSTSEMSINGSYSIRLNSGDLNQIDTTLGNSLRIVNRNIQKRINDQNNQSFSSSFSYRKKFARKGRNMSLNGQYGNNNNDIVNNILSNFYNGAGLINPINSYFQDQENKSLGNNYSIGGTYNEPISKNWTWSTSLSTRNNRTDLIKDFYNLDPENIDPRDLDETLSRSFDNSYRYSFFGQTFRFNKENLSASAGAEFQNSQLVGIPSVGAELSQPFNYIMPNASVEWEKPSIRLNYSSNLSEPSIDQLQPIVDNSDPVNIYEGNPNLKPAYRHNLRANYNWFDQFNFRSLFTSIRYTYTDNKIATGTTIDGFGTRRRKPVNTDFESSLSIFSSFGSPINSLKMKYRVGFNNSIVNGVTLINSRENKIDRLTNGASFTLENKSKKRFDISATTRWSWNNNIYRENKAQNASFVNQTYEANFILYPGKGWTVESRLEHYIYDQGSFSANTQVSLLNASVSKLLFKNKWQFKLRGFDLLNQNQGVNRSTSENGITETISNTIGRYVMLTALFDIKSFGDGKSSAQPGMPSFRMFH
jgi:hypothetical protein